MRNFLRITIPDIINICETKFYLSFYFLLNFPSKMIYYDLNLSIISSFIYYFNILYFTISKLAI